MQANKVSVRNIAEACQASHVETNIVNPYSDPYLKTYSGTVNEYYRAKFSSALKVINAILFMRRGLLLVIWYPDFLFPDSL